MNVGLQVIADNLQMDWGIILLIVLVAASLVFYAINFQLGVIFTMLSAMGCFMLAYANKADGWNYVPAITIMFLSLAMLSLSLYISRSGRYGTGLL